MLDNICLFICGIEGSGHNMSIDIFRGNVHGLSSCGDIARPNTWNYDSFPQGQPRNPYRRPNIEKMYKTAHDMGAEMRTIVLLRNPIYATYSGVRRGFADATIQQEVIDVNMAYLSREICKLPADTVMPLMYDHIVKDPESYREKLASFVGTDASKLNLGIVKKSKNIMPQRAYDDYAKFFVNREYHICNDNFSYEFKKCQETFEITS